MGGYLWTQPPADSEPKHVQDDCNTPAEILTSILRIEKQCCPPSSAALASDHLKWPNGHTTEPEGTTGADDALSIKVLLDEPDIRFCVCQDMESPVIIACLWARVKRAGIEDVMASLCQERAQWDTGGKNLLLQKAQAEDELAAEVYHSIIKCPRPFWDREVLKRQWKLPLESSQGSGCDSGCALVSKSMEDASVQESPGHVRAFVHKAGFLLRPSPYDCMPEIANGEPALATELTSCSQIDMGGLIPAWATSYLASTVAGKARSWVSELQQHCDVRKGEEPVPTLAEISSQLSPDWAERWDKTEEPDCGEETEEASSFISVKSLRSLSWSPF